MLFAPDKNSIVWRENEYAEIHILKFLKQRVHTKLDGSNTP